MRRSRSGATEGGPWAAFAEYVVSGYRAPCAWWESVVFARKAALSLLFVTLGPRSALLPLGGAAVEILSLCAQLLVSPMAARADNLLEAASLASLAFAFSTLPASRTVGGVGPAVGALLVLVTACCVARLLWRARAQLCRRK